MKLKSGARSHRSSQVIAGALAVTLSLIGSQQKSLGKGLSGSELCFKRLSGYSCVENKFYWSREAREYCSNPYYSYQDSEK